MKKNFQRTIMVSIGGPDACDAGIPIKFQEGWPGTTKKGGGKE